MGTKQIIRDDERMRIDKALTSMKQRPISGDIEETLAAATFRAHLPRDLGTLAVSLVAFASFAVAYLSVLSTRSTSSLVLISTAIFGSCAAATVVIIAVLVRRSTHAAAAHRIVEHRISITAEALSAAKVLGRTTDEQTAHRCRKVRRRRQRSW